MDDNDKWVVISKYAIGVAVVGCAIMIILGHIYF